MCNAELELEQLRAMVDRKDREAAAAEYRDVIAALDRWAAEARTARKYCGTLDGKVRMQRHAAMLEDVRRQLLRGTFEQEDASYAMLHGEERPERIVRP